MDSSRFVQLVMKELRIILSRTTKEQYKEGKEINIKDMIPGDWIYYDNGKGIEDVGLYIGNNTIIHASSVKGKVVEENIGSHNNIKLLEHFYFNIEKDNLYYKFERTPLKYNDNGCRFLLDDFKGNGIMDLFCLYSQADRTILHILNGSNNYEIFITSSNCIQSKLWWKMEIENWEIWKRKTRYFLY